MAAKWNKSNFSSWLLNLLNTPKQQNMLKH